MDIKKKCWECGASIKGTNTNKREYCDRCLAVRKLVLEGQKVDFNYLRGSNMLEKAVRIIENDESGNGIDNYKDDISFVSEYIEKHPQKFGSIYEIVASIILHHNMVKVIPQYKVASYRCDFALPELKVALEVDGELHDKFYDSERDLVMLMIKKIGCIITITVLEN